MPHKILELLKRIVENLIVYLFQVDKMAFYIYFIYVLAYKMAPFIQKDITFIIKRDHCVSLALCNGNYYYNVVLTHNKGYIIGTIHSFTPYYISFNSQRLLSLLLLFQKGRIYFGICNGGISMIKQTVSLKKSNNLPRT